MQDQPKAKATILATELDSILNEVVLVDVRDPEENEECKIPDSKLIPLYEIEDRAKNELDIDSSIVVYCAHGIRSMDALFRLKLMGFKNVKSLTGGIEAWLQHKNGS